MDKRKELKEQYKNKTVQAGIFRIVNPHGEQLLLGKTTDLEAMANRMRFQLKYDTNLSAQLRENCRQFGAEKLVYEALEVIKTDDLTRVEIDEKLEEALEKWQQA